MQQGQAQHTPSKSSSSASSSVTTALPSNNSNKPEKPSRPSSEPNPEKKLDFEHISIDSTNGNANGNNLPATESVALKPAQEETKERALNTTQTGQEGQKGREEAESGVKRVESVQTQVVQVAQAGSKGCLDKDLNVSSKNTYNKGRDRPVLVITRNSSNTGEKKKNKTKDSLITSYFSQAAHVKPVVTGATVVEATTEVTDPAGAQSERTERKTCHDESPKNEVKTNKDKTTPALVSSVAPVAVVSSEPVTIDPRSKPTPKGTPRKRSELDLSNFDWSSGITLNREP